MSQFTIPTHDQLTALFDQISTKPHLRDHLYPLLLAHAGKRFSKAVVQIVITKALIAHAVACERNAIPASKEDNLLTKNVICAFVGSETHGNELYECFINVLIDGHMQNLEDEDEALPDPPPRPRTVC